MVYVHFAEGFEEIEAVTIVDVLRRGGVDTKSVSVTGKREVCGSHGIIVCTDILFDEAIYDECEMLVLPGGMPGADNLLAHRELGLKITAFAESKKYLAAICAAPMVFGKLGILKNRKATIYPGMEENLTDAEVKSDRVVRDGNIITSRSAGTAMEFALTLVESLKGRETSLRLAQAMAALTFLP